MAWDRGRRKEIVRASEKRTLSGQSQLGETMVAHPEKLHIVAIMERRAFDVCGLEYFANSL
jgi:hypothetical protein